MECIYKEVAVSSVDQPGDDPSLSAPNQQLLPTCRAPHFMSLKRFPDLYKSSPGTGDTHANQMYFLLSSCSNSISSKPQFSDWVFTSPKQPHECPVEYFFFFFLCWNLSCTGHPITRLSDCHFEQQSYRDESQATCYVPSWNNYIDSQQ